MAQTATATRFTSMKLRSANANDPITSSSVVESEAIMARAVPFIQDRLYFVSARVKPTSTADLHFFSIDDVFVYMSYNEDFGPLNLAMVTKYCRKINRKLKLPRLASKKIVHVTSLDKRRQVNAAFLIAAYGILYLNMSPNAAHNLVVAECQRANRHHGNHNRNNAALIPFRDASIAKSSYELHLLDVLDGLKRAVDCGFYNPETFDVPEYERREQVENGDSNWILPGKLMAFCGPHPRARIDASGFPFHSPESYFDYFRSNGVKAVVRLNMATYEGRRFTSAGFTHYDLFFPDGTTPTGNILDKFLTICEKTDGAVAIHCKAGLGRTGTLIACYLMKHFRFTAPQAMGWIRVCRPGSVIGCQQNWLLERQTEMWGRGAEAEKLKREEEEKLKKKLIDGAAGAALTKRTTMKKGLSKDKEERSTASSSGSKATTTDARRKTSVKGMERREEATEGEFRNKLSMTSLDKQQTAVDIPVRRKCWISKDLNKSFGLEEERDEALSQGDMLNRRKMSMKRNVLVEVVRRSSSASSTATSKGSLTTNSTKIPPAALQRHSSGRFGGRPRDSSDSHSGKSTPTKPTSPSSAPSSPVARNTNTAVVFCKSRMSASPKSSSDRGSVRKTPTSRCHPCGGAGYTGFGGKGYLTRASVLNDVVGERDNALEGIGGGGSANRSLDKGAQAKKYAKEN